MGLLKRILGGKEDSTPAVTAPASLQFHEEDSTEDPAAKSTPKRELVQVVLRDTMRKHGIPSDWIELRMLTTVNRTGRAGMHVSFVVREAHERLLAYVFPFQDHFERDLARFEPRADDWVLSIGWEFPGRVVSQKATMPPPSAWVAPATAAAAAPLMPLDLPGAKAEAPEAEPEAAETEAPEDDIERDLRALFAIRDAAMTEPKAGPTGFEITRPGDDPDPTHPGA